MYDCTYECLYLKFYFRKKTARIFFKSSQHTFTQPLNSDLEAKTIRVKEVIQLKCDCRVTVIFLYHITLQRLFVPHSHIFHCVTLSLLHETLPLCLVTWNVYYIFIWYLILYDINMIIINVVSFVLIVIKKNERTEKSDNVIFAYI